MSIPSSLKIALVSGPNCGQSTLIQRFNRGVFVPDLPSTPTSTFSSQKAAIVGDKRIALAIWGTPGHKAYAQFAEMSIKGASCIIFVYSVDNAEQFEEIIQKIRNTLEKTPDQVAVLVGTRNDLQRAIPLEKAQEAAQEFNIPQLECSAYTGDGVEEVFRQAIKQSLKSRQLDFDEQIEFE